MKKFSKKNTKCTWLVRAHKNTEMPFGFDFAAYLVKAITYFFDAKNLYLFWLFCILHLKKPINTKFYWMVLV